MSLKTESVWFKTKLVSQFLTLSFLLTQPFYLSYLHAAPAGGNIVGGTGSISQSDLTTTINQTSQNLAVNWQSFDVNTNEKVNFIQPNSSSIALNRILGNNGSTIQGQVNANGQVILINPNGIFFTPTATINVGGLVASSLDMAPSDFMNGNYILNEVIGTDGTIINSGLINASIGGNVALIGKKVKNEGLISANLGSVILAAGKQSILTFDNQGLVGIKVTKEVLQEEIGLGEAVINSGEIKASGGRVLLTASTSQDVFSQAVNTNQLEQATSVVVNNDGTFTLGDGSDVLNTGSIDVSSESDSQGSSRIVLLGENITNSGRMSADVVNGHAGEIEIHAKDKTLLTENSLTTAQALLTGKGGLIKVLGDKVGLFDYSQVNASGANGGGAVLIGGDRQGLNTSIRNANFIYLGEFTAVNADATDYGDGGKIITFAEDTAQIYAKLYARGGLTSGNGGFIETSGLKGFSITQVPDISAPNGNGGLWLIDPYNITIVNTADCSTLCNLTSPFTSSTLNSYIDVDLIRQALSTSDVTITTGNAPITTAEAGDISFQGDLIFAMPGNTTRTLTLDASRNITFTTTSSISRSSNNDSLNLVLNAGGDISLSTDAAGINTYNGSLNVTSGLNFNSGGAILNLGSGTLNIDAIPAAGNVNLGNVTATNLSILNVNSISQQASTNLTINGTTDLSANAATNSIILTNNNDFNLLKIQGSVADITDINNINLEAGTNLSTSLKVTAGQDIGDNGAISISNAGETAVTTFDAGRDITIDGNNDNFNILNITNARNVDITDSSIGISISANTGTGSGGITGTFNLVTSGNGNIIDSGEVNVGGNASFSVQNSQSILLDNVNNTFGGTVNFLAQGGGTPKINNLTFYDTSALTLPSIDITGDLNVTGLTIEFDDTVVSGALTAEATSSATNINSIFQVNGTSITNATSTSVFTSNGHLLLDESNNFNNLRVAKSNNATIVDDGGIYFAANSGTNQGGVEGNLDLTVTNGDINSFDEVNVGTNFTKIANFTVDDGATITLDNDTNTFNGDEIFFNVQGPTGSRIQNVTIFDDTALDLSEIRVNGSLTVQASSISFAHTHVNDDGAGSGESFSATATNGDITQSTSHINVEGVATTIFEATGDITLTDSGNNFNDVTVVGANHVSLRDSDSMSLLGSDTSGNLSLQTGSGLFLVGNITTNSGTTASGNVEFTGNVLLAPPTDGETITINTNHATLGDGSVTFVNNVDNDQTTTTPRNNLEIISGNGDVDFQGGVGTSTANIGSLVINNGLTSTAIVNLNAVNTRTNVSDSTNAVDITAGTINLAGNIVTNNGGSGHARGINFDGNVVLGANVTLLSNNSISDGAVSISGTVNSDTTNRALTIETDTGTVDLQQTVGGVSALSSLDINSGTGNGIVNLAAVNTNGGANVIRVDGSSITLNGDVTSNGNGKGGDIRFDGNVVINNSVAIDSAGTGSNGQIDVNGSINGNNVTNSNTLTIMSGDNAVNLNSIGTTEEIQKLTITNTSGDISVGTINTRDNTLINGDSGVAFTSSGNINLNGDITTNVIGLNGSQAGNIDINGAVSLGSDVSIATNNVTDSGWVDFSSTIESSTPRSLSIDAGTENVTVAASIGGNNNELSGLTILNAGTVDIGSISTQSGGIDISATTLDLRGTLDTTVTGNAGAINLDTGVLGNINLLTPGSTITFDTNASSSDANITLSAALINNTTSKNLVLDAGNADVSMTGSAGVGIALNSLTATGDNVSLGQVNSIGAIDITGNTRISLDGNLTVTDSASDITLNNGNVVLTRDVALTTTGSSSVTVDGTINADSNVNNRLFSVRSGTGAIDLQGDIGNSQAVQSLMLSTAGTISIRNISTRSGGVSVNADTLNLAGSISTIDDATSAGEILLSQDNLNINSNVSLSSNSAAGTDANISILDPLPPAGMAGNGNSLALDAGNGTVAVTAALTGLSSFTVTDSQQTSLAGVITNNGNITVNSTGNITLGGSYDSGTADMSFNADTDINGSGLLTLTNTSQFDGNNISYSAYALDANPVSINATNSVAFNNTLTRIVLGNNYASSTYYLSNALLDLVNTPTLQVRSDNSYVMLNGATLADNSYALELNGQYIYSYGTDSNVNNLNAKAASFIGLYKNIYSENDLSLTAPTIYSYNSAVGTELNSSSGNINLAGNISGFAALDLNALNNSVNIIGDTMISLNDNLNVHATSINHGNLTASNDVSFITEGTYTQVNSIASTNGNITLVANNGDIELGYNRNNTGTIQVHALNGAITDNNGNATNIETAGLIDLYAKNGIGHNDPLEIISLGQNTSLTAVNTGSGNIEISNTGTILLDDISNTKAGNEFSIQNNGTVTVNSITLDKSSDLSIATFDVTNGDVLGVQGNTKHLTANSAIFNMNNTGSIGALGASFITDVPNKIEIISSLSTYIEYYGQVPPKEFIGDNAYKNRALQAIESLSGQQLIEVESLAEIDPAIFTDVRNYSHSDIALMMPSDQRYDVSDDEEEDEEDKEKRNKLIHSQY